MEISKTKEDARGDVWYFLAENGAIYENGVPSFGLMGICDWFSIPGRFPYQFTPEAWDDETLKSEYTDREEVYLVTPEIWEHVKSNYADDYDFDKPGTSQVEYEHLLVLLDIDGEPITERNIVGKKWCVIVDLHN